MTDCDICTASLANPFGGKRWAARGPVPAAPAIDAPDVIVPAHTCKQCAWHCQMEGFLVEQARAASRARHPAGRDRPNGDPT